MGIWLVLAAWAVARAMRWATAARQANQNNIRLKALLAAAPSAYLLISKGRRTAASASLLSMLGLQSELESVEDLRGLDTQFRGDDIAALIDEIISLPVSGRSFDCLLRSTVDKRILRAEGRIPPSELVGENGVVVWFCDVTECAVRSRFAARAGSSN